ncbi:ABC transporter ATP-binding protein [Spirillospora sp. NPDC050679]
MSEGLAKTPGEPLLSVAALRKVYPGGRGRGGGHTVAVEDVSFELEPGLSTALVGESGSGKSTCARLIVGLEPPTAGEIRIAGRDAVRASRTRQGRRSLARDVQLVFQDPYSSLDPRQRVSDALAEVLRLHGGNDDTPAPRRVAELLELVGLDQRQSAALPRALSGGQRQRVAIARALAARPRVLILDEAVAALDVSIQAQVLTALQDVRSSTGVALLFITHDLAVAEVMCDRVLVMRHGRIVEAGPMRHILTDPSHSYTRELLGAVPHRGWTPARRDRSATVTEQERFRT